MAERVMTLTRIHAEIAGAVLAVIIGGVALHEHDAHLRAEAVATAGQQSRDEANKQSQEQIKTLQQQIEQVKNDNKQQVAQLISTVAALKTPQQQATWSQQQLEQAIKGITITLDSKGQAVATIPAASLPELPAVIEKCKTCELNLDATTKQLTFSQQQQQQLASQLVNITKERDDWKVSARGGTTWQRTKRALKYIVVAGGVGYVLGKKF